MIKGNLAGVSRSVKGNLGLLPSTAGRCANQPNVTGLAGSTCHYGIDFTSYRTLIPVAESIAGSRLNAYNVRVPLGIAVRIFRNRYAEAMGTTVASRVIREGGRITSPAAFVPISRALFN